MAGLKKEDVKGDKESVGSGLSGTVSTAKLGEGRTRRSNSFAQMGKKEREKAFNESPVLQESFSKFNKMRLKRLKNYFGKLERWKKDPQAVFAFLEPVGEILTADKDGQFKNASKYFSIMIPSDLDATQKVKMYSKYKPFFKEAYQVLTRTSNNQGIKKDLMHFMGQAIQDRIGVTSKDFNATSRTKYGRRVEESVLSCVMGLRDFLTKFYMKMYGEEDAEELNKEANIDSKLHDGLKKGLALCLSEWYGDHLQKQLEEIIRAQEANTGEPVVRRRQLSLGRSRSYSHLALHSPKRKSAGPMRRIRPSLNTSRGSIGLRRRQSMVHLGFRSDKKLSTKRKLFSASEKKKTSRKKLSFLQRFKENWKLLPKSKKKSLRVVAAIEIGFIVASGLLILPPLLLIPITILINDKIVEELSKKYKKSDDKVSSIIEADTPDSGEKSSNVKTSNIDKGVAIGMKEGTATDGTTVMSIPVVKGIQVSANSGSLVSKNPNSVFNSASGHRVELKTRLVKNTSKIYELQPFNGGRKKKNFLERLGNTLWGRSVLFGKKSGGSSYPESQIQKFGS